MLRYQHEGSSALPLHGRAGQCPAGPSRPLSRSGLVSIMIKIILSGEGVVSSVDAVTVELPSVIRQLESVFRPSSI